MSVWLYDAVRRSRTTGIGISGILQQSRQFNQGAESCSGGGAGGNTRREPTPQEYSALERLRTAALVEVLITYGSACSQGHHGINVFRDLRLGLESAYGTKVFVLAHEERESYSCFSVHVNNVLVFGCQGRRPTVEQLCAEIDRAIAGQRPRLIPYCKAIVCDYYGCLQKHKYLI